MEYKVSIGGVEYGMGDIESVSIEAPLFDKLSVGNACAAELNMTFWPLGPVPRMAEIIPYAWDNGWKQLGVFYLDERTTSGEKMTIVAYNSMLKAEVEWIPSDELVFPMSMSDAIKCISGLMDVAIDPRTVVSDSYTIDYPANEYTLRDVLRFVAAAHAGNWIITANNELLLVPLFASMPEETSSLVTENGDAIVL
jgi:hypothetical protein